MRLRLLMFLYCAGLLAITATASAETVGFQLTTLNADGVRADKITVGDTFELLVTVQDIRAEPQGVVSAYLDLTYDDRLVSVIPNSLEFGSSYGDIPTGQFRAGLVDEVGSFAAGFLGIPPIPDPLGGDELEFFRLRFTADAIGDAHFGSNEADILPLHATTVRRINDGVPASEILFGSTTLTIVPEPPAAGMVLGGIVTLALFRWRALRRLSSAVSTGGSLCVRN